MLDRASAGRGRGDAGAKGRASGEREDAGGGRNTAGKWLATDCSSLFAAARLTTDSSAFTSAGGGIGIVAWG